MASPTSASAPSPLADQLRHAGVRVTPVRLRVLALLQAASQPLSHGDVLDSLAAESDAPVDRVTLYRVLDSLVGSGLALKAVDPRGVFRYSGAAARHRHEGHVHFRCTGCGGVFCLAARPPPPPRLPRGFRLAAAEFDLSGTCPACSGG